MASNVPLFPGPQTTNMLFPALKGWMRYTAHSDPNLLLVSSGPAKKKARNANYTRKAVNIVLYQLARQKDQQVPLAGRARNRQY